MIVQELFGGTVAQNGADNRTILLAEDDPGDEILALRAIEEARIKNRVVVARDGVEALDFLFGTGNYAGRDTSLMPELVLLDLMMPRLNGVDVLRRMRSNEGTNSLPVLVVVSSAEQQVVLDGYGLDADGYLHKPVDFIRLTEAVRRLELRWEVSN